MIQDEFATRCPLTCQDVSLQCIQPSCQTGCRCRDGEYLQDGHCIPREECNCMLDMADIVQRNQKYLKMLSMDAVGLMLRTTPQPPPPALYQGIILSLNSCPPHFNCVIVSHYLSFFLSFIVCFCPLLNIEELSHC